MLNCFWSSFKFSQYLQFFSYVNQSPRYNRYPDIIYNLLNHIFILIIPKIGRAWTIMSANLIVSIFEVNANVNM